METPERIVSVTPIAVERDKRTYQNAASFARLGYISTVVEGERSSIDRDRLPFELITIDGAASGPSGQGSDPTVEGVTVPKSHPLVEAMPRPISALLKRVGAWLLPLTNRVQFPLFLRRSLRRDNELAFESLPEADLYYLTFYRQFPAVARMCRRTGAGFIYDANDAYWAWPGYRSYPASFRIRLRRLEGRCVRRAAAFITVSEGVAELLERRYGRRPQVVRNLHDVRVDEQAERDVRQAAGLDDEAFVLVVVGNEKPSDAVEEALQALSHLPDRIHLVLLGAGYEKHLPLARELNVEERVHTLPPVAPTKVTSAIRTADAGLINTRAREVHMHALPTRLFSSIVAGLPVLYPPLPEVRSLAEAHGLGLPIDAEDPESIAAAVRRLAENPELVARYRDSVERAREELSWEREERLLAEIVAKALDRGG